MARIDSLGEASPYHVPDRKKAQKKEKGSWRTFSRMVEEAARGERPGDGASGGRGRRSIEELLDEVFTAGGALKAAPTLDAIREYRERVQAFLRHVVDHMLAVEESTSGGNILRRKRYTLIRVIDGKLEALAASVLSAQREQLGILAQVDEINGMLVDLVS
jgi:uncharacterized protein YaaR (DUF327 family)